MKNSFLKAIGIALAVVVVMFNIETAHSLEKEKKRLMTQYWMSIATQKMSMPGMSEEMSGMGGLFGKMMGGPTFGPSCTLLLQLNSPQALPSDPHATHDIPPGQKMGEPPSAYDPA